MLRDLEATAYRLDKSLLDEKFSLARRTFLAILKWVNMLNYRLKVGATYVVWFHFSDTTS